jgi:hypothetical protein
MLGRYATSRKVAGLRPDDVIEYFHYFRPLPATLWAWGLLSLSRREDFWGGKARPARKANNLPAICEPIV